MVTFLRTFSHDGIFGPACREWGCMPNTFTLSVSSTRVISSLHHLAKQDLRDIATPYSYTFSLYIAPLPFSLVRRMKIVFVIVSLCSIPTAIPLISLSLSHSQGVTRRCRLSELNNSAPTRAQKRGVAGFQPMRTAVHIT
jgi:hypothetical protein